ncbi:hypothetical protein ETD86_27170 [Nonomuraea turkmeniaca]|uniref:Uncharacterized protein n=1 Tax=Nonomuraea turkmeniaca TaxID=103838 RepID=A0A5S4FBU5_9ACTN|nr:hypothetical protein [Nonomuraea turkmeniaca]TMR15462.1 hypothetical protein ETD86_27170 [Nonomuraea turkmeniaca]
MRLFLVSLLLLPLLAASPAQAAAALPGGRPYYVVATAHLTPDNAYQNWGRLSWYTFSTSGTVSSRTWTWEQARRTEIPRTKTGTLAGSPNCTDRTAPFDKVLPCYVRTAHAYTDPPTEERTGTFSLSGDVLHITWNVSSGSWSEEWYVSTNSAGTLAKLEFKYNTKATHGFGYGSTSGFSTRRAMETVEQYSSTLYLRQWSWSNKTLTPPADLSKSVFQLPSYTQCDQDSWCLTYLQPSSSAACQKGGCPTYGGGTTPNITSIQYYLAMISNGDRRDTLWHFCSCLPMEQALKDNDPATDPYEPPCYTGNSHVKPLMQIIDDNGQFQGWVGIEASVYPYSAPPGEDVRDKDMFAVLRIADFL